MNPSAQFLSPSEAARTLGVSAKALRLYEQRGLVTPLRTAAGWRTYGPTEMARANEIVALRALGLSLAQTGRVLDGDAQHLEPALAAHQAVLEHRIRQLRHDVEKVRGMRDELARGQAPSASDLAGLNARHADLEVAFDLPWPWGGERFELREVRALNYIIGPLGSGKTRLALRLAEILPGSAFLPLDRAEAGGAETLVRLDADPGLKASVDQALAWLIEDGATASDALLVLLTGLEAEGPQVFVVDMLEQGLDEATQAALIAYLRQKAPSARPIFMLTRSQAVLDLAAVGRHETIWLCPANHSPPTRVAPYAGAPGYEAVATCLASPEARARTEGMVAVRPKVG